MYLGYSFTALRDRTSLIVARGRTEIRNWRFASWLSEGRRQLYGGHQPDESSITAVTRNEGRTILSS